MSSSNFVLGMLREAIQEARRDPDVLADLRELIALLASSTPDKAIVEPPAVYTTVAEFAMRCGFSKRHVENLIRQGLPIVGQGRGRRVPIAQADSWLANSTDKGIEERARRDAARVFALRAVKP